MNAFQIFATTILYIVSSIACAAGHLTDEKLAAAAALLLQNDIDPAGISITQFLAYKNGGGVVSGYQLHDGLKVFDITLTYHFGEEGSLVHEQYGKQDLSDLVISLDEVVSASLPVDRLPDDDDASTVRKCAAQDNLERELGIYFGKVAWMFKCADRRPQAIYLDATDGTVLEGPIVSPVE